MDEPTKRRWDVILGLLTPPTAVLGILVGIWQFHTGESNKVELEHGLLARQSQIEFQRRLWLDQLTAYQEIARLAGKVATEQRDGAKFEELLKEFTAAYWGTMIFVENDAVETAMVNFYVEANDYREGWSNPDRLKKRANELIKACRESSEATWRSALLMERPNAP